MGGTIEQRWREAVRQYKPNPVDCLVCGLIEAVCCLDLGTPDRTAKYRAMVKREEMALYRRTFQLTG